MSDATMVPETDRYAPPPPPPRTRRHIPRVVSPTRVLAPPLTFSLSSTPPLQGQEEARAREAHERRVARETLEARIRVVLAASPEDRTPEQTALLDAHPSVVWTSSAATLERALLRKSQTEARLEEREDPLR